MSPLLVIITTATLAAVLGWAGLSKVRGHRSTAPGATVADEMSQWRILGVPRPLRGRWAVLSHPWAELALAAALVTAPHGLLVPVAVAALLLCLGYWLVIAGALARRVETTCSCFGPGRRSPVSPAALVRNTLLVGLAASVLAQALRGASVPGAVRALPASGWLALAAAAAAAALAALIAVESQPEASDAAPRTPAPARPAAPAPGAVPDREGEYVRMRTPSLSLTRADGTETGLRELSAQRPALLLSLSTVCGSCIATAARVPEWRALLPMVDIWIVTRTAIDAVARQQPTWEGVLHDEGGIVARSLDAAATPSAVLLGADGLLAGGPVTGLHEIEELVGEIAEALRP